VSAALRKRRSLPSTDRQLLDQLDELVAAAAAGNTRAIGAIAIAFTPLLLKEARQELGRRHRQDAGDVLQEFFLALVVGKLTFPSIRGGALPWMKREVRSLANSARAASPRRMVRRARGPRTQHLVTSAGDT
jgi:DNA-directed RNA polymerase specialized sigma24 family protein